MNSKHWGRYRINCIWRIIIIFPCSFCHFACTYLCGSFWLRHSFFPQNNIGFEWVIAAGWLEMILLFPLGYIAVLLSDNYRIVIALLGLNSVLWGLLCCHCICEIIVRRGIKEIKPNCGTGEEDPFIGPSDQ